MAKEFIYFLAIIFWRTYYGLVLYVHISKSFFLPIAL